MPPDNNKEMLNRSDHDLLIRVDTKLDRAGGDIAELHKHISTVNTTMQGLMQSIDSKIAGAVADRVGTGTFNDFKKDVDMRFEDITKQIRPLQRYFWIGVGIVMVVEIIARYIKVG
jgi:hypothetical protein